MKIRNVLSLAAVLMTSGSLAFAQGGKAEPKHAKAPAVTPAPAATPLASTATADTGTHKNKQAGKKASKSAKYADSVNRAPAKKPAK